MTEVKGRSYNEQLCYFLFMALPLVLVCGTAGHCLTQISSCLYELLDKN